MLRCIDCKKEINMDLLTNIRGNREERKVGDIVVCPHCYKTMEFNKDLHLIDASPANKLKLVFEMMGFDEVLIIEATKMEKRQTRH